MKILQWCRINWDRAVAIGATILAFVVLAIGWNEVASTPYPAEQLPYILSAGVGALVLLGVAGTLWISADLRDEWRMLDRIERHLDETAADEPTSDADEPPSTNGQHAEAGAESDDHDLEQAEA